MMSLETTQELDKLYSVYKSLVGKEIECTNKVLSSKTIEERNACIEKAMRFSREASSVARAIKEIEDSGEGGSNPGE
jgi:hypothetical protein